MENLTCRFACPVALSSIFADWVILRWGIIALGRGWCSETDPSIFQHERDPCRLQSRFSTTDHRQRHFRRVTWKGDCAHFQEALRNLGISGILSNAKDSEGFLGWAAARRAAASSRLDGRVLKMPRVANSLQQIFRLILSVRIYWLTRLAVLSVPVYNLIWHFNQTLSRFQMWTFHFALNATFSIGFGYGLYIMMMISNTKDTEVAFANGNMHSFITVCTTPLRMLPRYP